MTSRRTLGWNEFALASAGATAAAIAIVLILGFNLGGDRFAIGVDDLGEAVAALIAAAACTWTRRSTPITHWQVPGAGGR